MSILRGKELISVPCPNSLEQKQLVPAERRVVGSPLLPKLPVTIAAEQASTRCEAYGWLLVEQLYSGNDLLSVFEKGDQQYFERFGQTPSQKWAQAMANILASVAWIGLPRLPAEWPVKLRDAGYFMTSELRGRFARGDYNRSLRALLAKLKQKGLPSERWSPLASTSAHPLVSTPIPGEILCFVLAASAC